MRQSRTPASFRAGAQKLVYLRVREDVNAYACGIGLTGIGRCPTPASFRASAQKLVDLQVREARTALPLLCRGIGLEHR